ncbi:TRANSCRIPTION FACTOR BHLH145 [Salix purpurea]|uniref:TRANSCRIPTION FACTOR BHLH145 n=1 Tax=Salix purpurea TaxID=77065 RepID=A0A9Q0PCN8_SALPP|nr:TRANSCRIPTION FACTOR BHLH145 [Salix purpurea]
MGEDRGYLFPQQQFNWQSPNMNYLGASFSSGQQNTPPLLMDPNNMVSANGLPEYPLAELLRSQVSQENEPSGWFYGLPRFRQAFMPPFNPVLKEKRPLLDTVLKEKLPTAPRDFKDIVPPSASGCAQKRFLVFDQSGDQTTLIFSSGIGTPAQCFKSWIPKPTIALDLNKVVTGAKENQSFHLGPIATDENVEDDGIDMQTDVHEDIEELNALLYSDDDNEYTEDEEVTSTGHSPSTMTTHDKRGWFGGSTEEVASSDGSNKKRKLCDGGYTDVPSLMDTASSVKPTIGFEYEDDAESRCDNGNNLVSEEMGSESANKRMRKERIRETVSILQNLIPDGKGKDAVIVLEEAIQYLKSLKFKAKALGLDAP